MKKMALSLMLVGTFLVPSAAFSDSKKDDVKVELSKEQKFNDWVYQCETIKVNGKAKNQICGLSQNFAIIDPKNKKKSETPVMRLQVHKMDQDGKKITILMVRTPLAIDLTSGVKLQANGKDYKAVPFTTCFAEMFGCRASFVIEKELQTALQAGQPLKIGYRTLDRRVVPVDVKTAGYSQGVKKL